MKAGQVLTLVRRFARQEGLTVRQLPGRGKGSHAMYLLLDSSGAEVERFGLTGHGSNDLSWRMLTRLEERLAPIFGEKWTEKS